MLVYQSTDHQAGTPVLRLEDGGLQEGHIAKLRGELQAAGDVSLQNALTTCMASLKAVPPYGHREVGLSHCLST